MGALASRVRLRLSYLAELFKQGVRFERLVFLGGARPLQADLESETVLLNPDTTQFSINPSWQKPTQLPTTEMEMMCMIYEQMDLPKKFRSIPVDFIVIHQCKKIPMAPCYDPLQQIP